MSAALEAEQNFSCVSGRSMGTCLPDAIAEAGLRSPSPEECSAHSAKPRACQHHVYRHIVHAKSNTRWHTPECSLH